MPETPAVPPSQVRLRRLIERREQARRAPERPDAIAEAGQAIGGFLERVGQTPLPSTFGTGPATLGDVVGLLGKGAERVLEQPLQFRLGTGAGITLPSPTEPGKPFRLGSILPEKERQAAVEAAKLALTGPATISPEQRAFIESREGRIDVERGAESVAGEVAEILVPRTYGELALEAIPGVGIAPDIVRTTKALTRTGLGAAGRAAEAAAPPVRRALTDQGGFLRLRGDASLADIDKEMARLQREIRRAGREGLDTTPLEDDLIAARDAREFTLGEKLGEDYDRLLAVREQIDEAQAMLEGAQTPRARVPHFGTPEREAYDEARRRARESGHRVLSKAQEVAEARARHNSLLDELQALERGEVRPSGEEVVQQMRREREAAQRGTMQAGMGIGETPPQGQLFENLQAGERAAPLADPEQLAIQQGRRAEVARGQQELPGTPSPQRQLPSPRGAESLTPPQPAPQGVQQTLQTGSGVRRGDIPFREGAPEPTFEMPATPAERVREKRVPLWARSDIAEQAAGMGRRPPPPSLTARGAGPAPEGLPSGRTPGGPQNIREIPHQDQYAKMREALAPEKRPLGKRLADAKQGFLRDFYDRNFPLKELEQETGIPAHKLAQVVPGATAAGEDIIRRVYRPILERVTDDIPFLEEYMVLRRNEDILARNPEALLPGGVHGLQGTLEALGTLERRLGEGRFRAVQEAADALWRANDEHVLGPLLNEGILSREQYTAIASANRHYIPWQRADYADVFENAMTRPEASVSSTGLVRLTEEGSTRKLDNPLARLEAQVIKTQRVLSRNRAAKGIAEALYDMERRTGEKVIEFVDPQMARAQRGTARTAETGARFVAEGESSAAKETISWFENGQKRTAVVPSIYGHVAKNLDAEPNNVILNFLRATAAPLRHGAVTYNPAFLVVNPMRDAFSAFFREKLVPLSPDYFAGWTAVITKNADFSEAAQSGALLSGLAETFQTTDALKRAQRLGSVQLKSPKDALLIVPRLLEAANIVAEQATRVATFRKLRRQGISQLEAAVRARDATVDFRKAGTTVQAINQMIPFFNAAIQGSVNTARTIRNNPRWAAVAAGAFMVPTVITRLNNQRFETNGLIPDYEYTTNWVIQVADGTRKDGTKFPLYVKVPKGQIASIMTLPGETLFHMARVTEDRSALEVLLQSGLDVAQAVSPVDPSFSGIAPPALQTIAGVSTNRDIFTGQPIVPLREERLAPEQQFGPETSRLAILMGQAAGISPRLLDFAIKDYTAGAGEASSWVLDLGMEALGFTPETFGEALQAEQEGAEALARTPVIRRFFGTRGTQIERRGFDNLREAVRVTNKEFTDLPGMNRLGVRLGEVGFSIDITPGVPGDSVDLTPEQRARYQQVMGETVLGYMADYAAQLRERTDLSNNQKRDAIMARLSALKDAARDRFILLEKDGLVAEHRRQHSGAQQPSQEEAPPVRLRRQAPVAEPTPRVTLRRREAVGAR